MKQAKQRYIPSGYYQAYDDGLTTIYHKDEKKPISLVYVGKQSKPLFHIMYQTAEQRAEANKKVIEGQKLSYERKLADRAERAKPHTLQIGDILYSSWGWEQTNVDFYEVVEVTKHGATLQEIGRKSVEQTGWASDTVVADPETKIGETFKVRVNGYNSVKLSSYQTAMKYDGTPRHRSWYA